MFREQKPDNDLGRKEDKELWEGFLGTLPQQKKNENIGKEREIL